MEYDGGLGEIGADPAADGGFSTDNELPRDQQGLPAYRLADRAGHQRRVVAFMADGDYRRVELGTRGMKRALVRSHR
jgi:hypothetical protein